MLKNNYIPLLLSSVPLLATAAVAQETEQPNIVVIIADDLGTNELGCYGGTNLLTPNIDQLATEGVRLTNNYASCAMSVPIRASLYTGLFPARHGSYQNHKASYNNIKSVTHYLSDLGYRVGRTGKDHPVGQSIVYGFEKIPGFTVDCVASKPPLATTDGIKEFMSRDNNEPFCLYVASIHPHMPWDAGDASKFNPNEVVLPPNCVDNAQTRNEFCRYLAEIQVLDDEVGKVMAALNETGNLDNTLVIFLGEQGPQMPFGKWTCYNYGQHSALIARYPAQIAQNTVNSSALVQYEDVLPTLIDFAGGEPIEGLDGTSFLDVLFGKNTEHREWAYGIHNNIPEGSAYPIRSIQDKQYKLIVNLTPEADYYEKHMMVVNGTNMWSSWLASAQTDSDAKFLTDRFVKRPAIELYDLQEDPWELNNIAANPEHAARIVTMRAALEAWMEQQGDRGVMMDTENPEDPNLKIPMAISSLDDINTYVRGDLSGNYYLANDIEIPEGTEWIPIGAESLTDGDPQRFRGIFDGRGHSIMNLKISTPAAFKGLFGRLHGGVVKDLDLVDIDIKGTSPIGGITGAMMAGSRIERVSVSGNIEGQTEVGGIAGRIARDGDRYNIIEDCYVSATITATNLSTSMDTPSCAGGIAAYTHSTSGSNYAKIDIHRTYFTGTVRSAQMNHVAGNAAGILAFYDNHKFVKMNEVLVLADEITAATPNLFFGRRGPTYADFEQFEKVFARDDIPLSYLNTNDKGRGGEIPAGVIGYFSPEVFQTTQFYDDNLSWDFENTWTVTEGEYPKLKRTPVNTSVAIKKSVKQYKVLSNNQAVDIAMSGKFTVSLYDLAGKQIRDTLYAHETITIPVEKGIYILKLGKDEVQYADKIIVI